MMRTAAFLLTVIVGSVVWLPAGDAADFEPKSITMVVGASAGGGNDLYARLLTRHLGRHLPGNPSFVVQNVPGAGGAVAANQLYAKAPRDGTTIGALTRVTTIDPLLSDQAFNFDALKFNWLGSMNKETNIVVVSGVAPVKDFDGTFKTETIVAAAGAGTDGVVYPKLMNRLLGTKFKVVAGYAGSDEMILAMERGEVHGRGGVPWSTIKTNHRDMLRDGRIVILVQLGLERNPELPDIPMMLDYAKDENHRQIFELLFARQDMGRPFVAPPDVPADRIKILRTAFVEATRDPKLLEEAKRMNTDIDVLNGEDMQALLVRLYATPKDIVEETKRELGSGQ